MTSDRPAAFFDLDADMFPFLIAWYRGDEKVHEVKVEGPGALEVPFLGDITRTVITYPDGTMAVGNPET